MYKIYKKTLLDCIKLAKSKNGICLSKEYKTVHNKYIWKCQKGHIWKSTYKCVEKCWCPVCRYDIIRHKLNIGLENCKNIAKKNGLIFLSNEYKNGYIKYEWKCKMGHVFNSSYKNICKINGCSKCNDKRYSNISIEWLEYMSKINSIYIQHAKNSEEFKIKNDNGYYYYADGFCRETNTWYEFMGNIYHCNPKMFKYNDKTYYGKKAEDIWEKDKKRESYIKSKGYNYVSIWESDWIECKKKL